MHIVAMVPAVLRVVLVFVLVLWAIRKDLSLGNALFLGALVLGAVFGLGPAAMAQSILSSLLNPKTLALTVMVCLILVFSHSMEAAGQMQRLLDRFQGLIAPPRINMVVFPALIGLLPMPGGAIFSAPMVKTLGARLQLTSAQLSFINYWFRHIWEYWWPLYPGVLLTTTLANLNLWLFVLYLFPLTGVALAIGYWPLRSLRLDAENPGCSLDPLEIHPATGPHDRALPKNTPAKQAAEEFSPDRPTQSSRPPLLPFLQELLPVLIVICLGLAGGALLSMLLQSYRISVTKELGLIFSLLVAIFWVWEKNRLSAAQRWQILKQKQLLSLFYMVAAILIFKGMLEDSRAVALISQELLNWRVPLMPICMILPFLVGGVVGLTIAFVGTTFPILISLLQVLNETQYMLPYMMLALVSGFVGVLLSPLHLCLLLSNEYFQTPLYPVYRFLWAPCAALLATACGYFLLLHG